VVVVGVAGVAETPRPQLNKGKVERLVVMVVVYW